MDDKEKRAGLLSGGQVTRRDVLKMGLVGAAGLTVLPTVLAACGSSATPAPAAITLGSNYSDPIPKKAMADMAAAFTAKSGTPVTINTVDHGTFQDQITNYLGGKPEDVFTWFSGFRMRAFVVVGLSRKMVSIPLTAMALRKSSASSSGRSSTRTPSMPASVATRRATSAAADAMLS